MLSNCRLSGVIQFAFCSKGKEGALDSDSCRVHSRWFICPAQCLTHSEHSVDGDLSGCVMGCFLSPGSLQGGPNVHLTASPEHPLALVEWGHQGGSASALLIPQYLHFCYLKSNYFRFNTLSLEGYLKFKQISNASKRKNAMNHYHDNFHPDVPHSNVS